MTKRRKTFSADFKAKVASEAIRGAATTAWRPRRRSLRGVRCIRTRSPMKKWFQAGLSCREMLNWWEVNNCFFLCGMFLHCLDKWAALSRSENNLPGVSS